MKRMNRVIGSLFAALVCAAAGTAGADGLVSYPAWTAGGAGWRIAPRGNYAVYCDLDAEGGRVPLFAAVEVRSPKRCRARLMFGSACPRKAWPS